MNRGIQRPVMPRWLPNTVLAFGFLATATTLAYAATGGFGDVAGRRAWCEARGYRLDDAAGPLPKLCLDADRRLVKPPM